MGLTIGNCHHSVDMGSGGFNRLRTKVAYLHSEELGKFYEELEKGFTLYGNSRKQFFEDYNKRLQFIDEELNVSHYILDFLYTSDIEGKMSVKHCRRIYNVIKDYDDNIAYGYTGRPDCAMFKDFKNIIKECRDKQIVLYWN